MRKGEPNDTITRPVATPTTSLQAQSKLAICPNKSIYYEPIFSPSPTSREVLDTDMVRMASSERARARIVVVLDRAYPFVIRQPLPPSEQRLSNGDN
jgi:hypothetical protein